MSNVIHDAVQRMVYSVDCQARDKEHAVGQMIEFVLPQEAYTDADRDLAASAILKREELGSSGIGQGVAAPHTKHSCVDRLETGMFFFKDGLEFDALDGEPVYIVFVLVSPPDLPGDHLRCLEHFTRRLRTQDFVACVKQAESRLELDQLALSLIGR